MLAESTYVASIDPDIFKACGVCADKRCPVHAVAEEDGAYRVVEERCIGCGVGTLTCPEGAVSLASRPEFERDIPFNNILEIFQARAMNRGIELKID